MMYACACVCVFLASLFLFFFWRVPLSLSLSSPSLNEKKKKKCTTTVARRRRLFCRPQRHPCWKNHHDHLLFLVTLGLCLFRRPITPYTHWSISVDRDCPC